MEDLLDKFGRRRARRLDSNTSFLMRQNQPRSAMCWTKISDADQNIAPRFPKLHQKPSKPMSTIVEETYSMYTGRTKKKRDVHLVNTLKVTDGNSSSVPTTTVDVLSTNSSEDYGATSHDVESLTLCRSSRSGLNSRSYTVPNISTTKIHDDDVHGKSKHKQRRKRVKRSLSNGDMYGRKCTAYPVSVDIPKESAPKPRKKNPPVLAVIASEIFAKKSRNNLNDKGLTKSKPDHVRKSRKLRAAESENRIEVAPKSAKENIIEAGRKHKRRNRSDEAKRRSKSKPSEDKHAANVEEKEATRGRKSSKSGSRRRQRRKDRVEEYDVDVAKVAKEKKTRRRSADEEKKEETVNVAGEKKEEVGGAKVEDLVEGSRHRRRGKEGLPKVKRSLHYFVDARKHKPNKIPQPSPTNDCKMRSFLEGERLGSFETAGPKLKVTRQWLDSLEIPPYKPRAPQDVPKEKLELCSNSLTTVEIPSQEQKEHEHMEKAEVELKVERPDSVEPVGDDVVEIELKDHVEPAENRVPNLADLCTSTCIQNLCFDAVEKVELDEPKDEGNAPCIDDILEEGEIIESLYAKPMFDNFFANPLCCMTLYNTMLKCTKATNTDIVWTSRIPIRRSVAKCLGPEPKRSRRSRIPRLRRREISASSDGSSTCALLGTNVKQLSRIPRRIKKEKVVGETKGGPLKEDSFIRSISQNSENIANIDEEMFDFHFSDDSARKKPDEVRGKSATKSVSFGSVVRISVSNPSLSLSLDDEVRSVRKTSSTRCGVSQKVSEPSTVDKTGDPCSGEPKSRPPLKLPPSHLTEPNLPASNVSQSCTVPIEIDLGRAVEGNVSSRPPTAHPGPTEQDNLKARRPPTPKRARNPLKAWRRFVGALLRSRRTAGGVRLRLTDYHPTSSVFDPACSVVDTTCSGVEPKSCARDGSSSDGSVVDLVADKATVAYIFQNVVDSSGSGSSSSDQTVSRQIHPFGLISELRSFTSDIVMQAAYEIAKPLHDHEIVFKTDLKHMLKIPVTHASYGVSYYTFKSYLRKYMYQKEMLRMLMPCIRGVMSKAPKVPSELLVDPEPVLEKVSSIDCKEEQKELYDRQSVIDILLDDVTEDDLPEDMPAKQKELLKLQKNQTYVYEIVHTDESSTESESAQSESIKTESITSESIKTVSIEPESISLESIEPESIEQESIEPESFEPESIEPESIEPESIEPESIEPESIEPESIEPESIEPESIIPESAEQESIMPESIEPESIMPEFIKSESIQSESIIPESIEPESIMPESIEPESIMPESIEPESITPEFIDEPESIMPESIELESNIPESFEPEYIMPESIEPESIIPESLEPESIMLESIEPESIIPESFEREYIMPESIEPESIMPESIKSESIRAESIEPESIMPDSIKSESIIAESIEPESIMPESIKPESIMAESIESESIMPESIRSESIKAESIESESIVPESIKSESIKTQSIKSESIMPESKKSESIKTESIRSESIKAESVRSESIKAESIRSESIKAESIKSESIKAGSIRPVPSEPISIKTESIKSKSIKSESIVSVPSEHISIKSEYIKSESIQSVNIEPLSISSMSMKADSEKPESIRSVPSEPVSIKSEPIKLESIKSPPSEVASVKSESVKSESVKFVPSEPISVKSEPVKSESVKSKSIKFLPSEPTSIQSEPLKSVSIKSEYLRSLPSEPEIETIKSESIKPTSSERVSLKCVAEPVVPPTPCPSLMSLISEDLDACSCTTCACGVEQFELVLDPDNLQNGVVVSFSDRELHLLVPPKYLRSSRARYNIMDDLYERLKDDSQFVQVLYDVITYGSVYVGLDDHVSNRRARKLTRAVKATVMTSFPYYEMDAVKVRRIESAYRKVLGHLELRQNSHMTVLSLDCAEEPPETQPCRCVSLKECHCVCVPAEYYSKVKYAEVVERLGNTAHLVPCRANVRRVASEHLVMRSDVPQMSFVTAKNETVRPITDLLSGEDLVSLLRSHKDLSVEQLDESLVSCELEGLYASPKGKPKEKRKEYEHERRYVELNNFVLDVEQSFAVYKSEHVRNPPILLSLAKRLLSRKSSVGGGKRPRKRRAVERVSSTTSTSSEPSKVHSVYHLASDSLLGKKKAPRPSRDKLQKRMGCDNGTDNQSCSGKCMCKQSLAEWNIEKAGACKCKSKSDEAKGQKRTSSAESWIGNDAEPKPVYSIVEIVPDDHKSQRSTFKEMLHRFKKKRKSHAFVEPEPTVPHRRPGCRRNSKRCTSTTGLKEDNAEVGVDCKLKMCSKEVDALPTTKTFVLNAQVVQTDSSYLRDQHSVITQTKVTSVLDDEYKYLDSENKKDAYRDVSNSNPSSLVNYQVNKNAPIATKSGQLRADQGSQSLENGAEDNGYRAGNKFNEVIKDLAATLSFENFKTRVSSRGIQSLKDEKQKYVVELGAGKSQEIPDKVGEKTASLKTDDSSTMTWGLEDASKRVRVKGGVDKCISSREASEGNSLQARHPEESPVNSVIFDKCNVKAPAAVIAGMSKFEARRAVPLIRSKSKDNLIRAELTDKWISSLKQPLQRPYKVVDQSTSSFEPFKGGPLRTKVDVSKENSPRLVNNYRSNFETQKRPPLNENVANQSTSNFENLGTNFAELKADLTKTLDTFASNQKKIADKLRPTRDSPPKSKLISSLATPKAQNNSIPSYGPANNGAKLKFKSSCELPKENAFNAKSFAANSTVDKLAYVHGPKLEDLRSKGNVDQVSKKGQKNYDAKNMDNPANWQFDDVWKARSGHRTSNEKSLTDARQLPATRNRLQIRAVDECLSMIKARKNQNSLGVQKSDVMIASVDNSGQVYSEKDQSKKNALRYAKRKTFKSNLQPKRGSSSERSSRSSDLSVLRLPKHLADRKLVTVCQDVTSVPSGASQLKNDADRSSTVLCEVPEEQNVKAKSGVGGKGVRRFSRVDSSEFRHFPTGLSPYRLCEKYINEGVVCRYSSSELATQTDMSSKEPLDTQTVLPSREPLYTQTDMASKELLDTHVMPSKDPLYAENDMASKEPLDTQTVMQSKDSPYVETDMAFNEPLYTETDMASKEPLHTQAAMQSKDPLYAETDRASKEPMYTQTAIQSKDPLYTQIDRASKEPMYTQTDMPSKEPIRSDGFENCTKETQNYVSPPKAKSEETRKRYVDDAEPRRMAKSSVWVENRRSPEQDATTFVKLPPDLRTLKFGALDKCDPKSCIYQNMKYPPLSSNQNNTMKGSVLVEDQSSPEQDRAKKSPTNQRTQNFEAADRCNSSTCVYRNWKSQPLAGKRYAAAETKGYDCGTPTCSYQKTSQVSPKYLCDSNEVVQLYDSSKADKGATTNTEGFSEKRAVDGNRSQSEPYRSSKDRELYGGFVENQERNGSSFRERESGGYFGTVDHVAGAAAVPPWTANGREVVRCDITGNLVPRSKLEREKFPKRMNWLPDPKRPDPRKMTTSSLFRNDLNCGYQLTDKREAFLKVANEDGLGDDVLQLNLSAIPEEQRGRRTITGVLKNVFNIHKSSVVRTASVKIELNEELLPEVGETRLSTIVEGTEEGTRRFRSMVAKIKDVPKGRVLYVMPRQVEDSSKRVVYVLPRTSRNVLEKLSGHVVKVIHSYSKKLWSLLGHRSGEEVDRSSTLSEKNKNSQRTINSDVPSLISYETASERRTQQDDLPDVVDRFNQVLSNIQDRIWTNIEKARNDVKVKEGADGKSSLENFRERLKREKMCAQGPSMVQVKPTKDRWIEVESLGESLLSGSRVVAVRSEEVFRKAQRLSSSVRPYEKLYSGNLTDTEKQELRNAEYSMEDPTNPDDFDFDSEYVLKVHDYSSAVENRFDINSEQFPENVDLVTSWSLEVLNDFEECFGGPDHHVCYYLVPRFDGKGVRKS